MKKILALILASALVLCLIPFSFAEQDIFTLSADPISGAVGETVTVYIKAATSLSGEAKINSLNLEFRFDPNALRFVEVARDDDGMISDFFKGVSSPLYNAPDSDPGMFIVAWADAVGSNQSGIMLGIQFEIISDSGSAITVNNFKFSMIETPTSTQEQYTVDPIILGGVSVGSSAVPTPDPSNTVNTTPDSTEIPVVTVTLPPQVSTPIPVEDIPSANTTNDPQGSIAPDSDASEQPSPTQDANLPVSPTEPTDPNADVNGSEGGTPVWIYIVGILGIVLIIGAAVTFVIQKKKQNG